MCALRITHTQRVPAIAAGQQFKLLTLHYSNAMQAEGEWEGGGGEDCVEGVCEINCSLTDQSAGEEQQQAAVIHFL